MTEPKISEQAEASLSALADRLADARILHEAASDTEKEYAKDVARIEAELFDALERAGIKSFRTERGLFLMNDLAWAKVTDEKAAREWADAEQPELLALNRQRLSVIVRLRIKAREEMPPGVDFTTQRKVNWRRV